MICKCCISRGRASLSHSSSDVFTAIDVLTRFFLTGVRATIRGSDDFYPQDTASHGPHLYSNAFNGLMIAR